MGKKRKKRKPGKPYIPTRKEDNIYSDIYAEASLDNGKWDYGNYTGLSGASYWKCHTGNTKVLSTSRGQGGSLFIGGWSRGAYHGDDMTVFDLTAARLPLRHSGSYYSISIDDFSVPQWSFFFWESIAMTVYQELTVGDVLIACQGGHGRSGMVTAIVAYMMRNKRHIRIPDRELLASDPVAWIQEVHCKNAVETLSQERCVYETCLACGDNPQIVKALAELNKRPRYTKNTKPSTEYGDVIAEWVSEPDQSDVYTCPLCTQEYGTMIEALMCCNTSNSLRYCPVCLTKHELPVDAYNCCRIAPPIFFEEDDYDPLTGGVKESK